VASILSFILYRLVESSQIASKPGKKLEWLDESFGICRNPRISMMLSLKHCTGTLTSRVVHLAETLQKASVLAPYLCLEFLTERWGDKPEFSEHRPAFKPFSTGWSHVF
jgi:hypothetical protein